MIRPLVLAAMLTAPSAAMALSLFGGLWTPPEPPEPPEEVAETLKDIRGSGCTGASDPNANAFAETAFGRGERPRGALPEEVQNAIAGIFAADSEDMRQRLAAPYLSSSNSDVAVAVRVSLAYATLRRRGTNRDGRASILDLLAQPSAMEDISDTHHIRAMLALERRAYKHAGDHAKRALQLAPAFYNAQVVASLALLSELPSQIRDGACANAMAQVTNALRPLFQGSACKLHVGHFDLAARRYLPPAQDEAGREADHIRQTILAYISGKDDSLAALKASAATGICTAALNAATGG